jgi:hypothetical protein
VEQRDDEAVRSHWLVGALEVMLSDRRPDGDPVTLELRPGDESIVLAARDGEMKMTLARRAIPMPFSPGPRDRSWACCSAISTATERKRWASPSRATPP